jgi:hypothetical protein
VSFAAITLCVVSQRVFIFVVYFVIDSVRKLLVTLSYSYETLNESKTKMVRNICEFACSDAVFPLRPNPSNQDHDSSHQPE